MEYDVMKKYVYINYILHKEMVESALSEWDFLGSRFNGAKVPPRSVYG